MSVNYDLQDKFLEKFFASQWAGDFFLTGGTALARFYFHHRESVDLDLFTQNKQVDFNEVNLSMVRILEELNLKITKQVITDTFLQYICEDATRAILKIDMVKDVPVHFGEITIKNNVRIDSLENIGSNKVLAIFGRTDAKDFIDLYFILQKTGLKFEELFEMAKRKDLGLTEFYLANAVRQIEQVTVYPVMLKQLDKQAMVKFYLDLSRNLLTKIKPEG